MREGAGIVDGPEKPLPSGRYRRWYQRFGAVVVLPGGFNPLVNYPMHGLRGRRLGRDQTPLARHHKKRKTSSFYRGESSRAGRGVDDDDSDDDEVPYVAMTEDLMARRGDRLTELVSFSTQFLLFRFQELGTSSGSRLGCRSSTLSVVASYS